jgi:transposase, IS30 family
LLTKLHDRKAVTKTEAVTQRLTVYSEDLRRTLTADNGSENTNHQEITQQTGMKVYFCHAYHSWEKGTVENTNGRIRRYIPKGVSIDTIPEDYLKDLEYKLNSTPRKCLQFLIPYEMMHKLHGATD